MPRAGGTTTRRCDEDERDAVPWCVEPRSQGAVTVMHSRFAERARRSTHVVISFPLRRVHDDTLHSHLPRGRLSSPLRSGTHCTSCSSTVDGDRTSLQRNKASLRSDTESGRMVCVVNKYTSAPSRTKCWMKARSCRIQLICPTVPYFLLPSPRFGSLLAIICDFTSFSVLQFHTGILAKTPIVEETRQSRGGQE